MSKPEPGQQGVFTSEELAAHIVDTLIDYGLIEKSRLKEAVSTAKWELDAQSAMGRVILKGDSQ